MEATHSKHEKVFFDDGTVIVTQSRFVANGRTFAMRNISSVTMSYNTPNRIFPTILIILGIIFLLLEGVRLYGFAIALVGAFLLYLNKSDYVVRINSNSGEQDGYVSTNKQYVEHVVNAINQAIIYRG